MLNKNKILYLTTVGVMSALSPTNAQTFYQCIPNTCPSGQYFDGSKCIDLPKAESESKPSQSYVCVYNFTAGAPYKTFTRPVSSSGKTASCGAGSNNGGWETFSCSITLSNGDYLTYNTYTPNTRKSVHCVDGVIQ